MPLVVDRTQGNSAFKEWAVSCAALGRGDQVLLLRKGGIHEQDSVFTLDHPAFFLYPTYEHQDPASVKPEAHGLLGEVQASRPGLGEQVVKHWAKVEHAWALAGMETVLRLESEHIYSPESVRRRWEWQKDRPLWALALRVYALKEPRRFEVLESYTGCKSWIELEGIDSAGLECQAVLGDGEFNGSVERLKGILGN
jgi:hypothetical protein